MKVFRAGMLNGMLERVACALTRNPKHGVVCATMVSGGEMTSEEGASPGVMKFGGHSDRH